MIRVKTVGTGTSVRRAPYDGHVPSAVSPDNDISELVGVRAIFTLPNLISLARLSCIPLFLWLLFGSENRLGAALLLGGLGATDWVDGFIARRFNQVSELGKVLDPAADRILFIVGVTGLYIDNSAPRWLCILVVVREAIIAILLSGLTLLGMKRFPVTWWGKLATFLLMFAFPLFLLSNADAGLWSSGAKVLAWACAIPGVLISYVTFADYLPKMKVALAEGRKERRS